MGKKTGGGARHRRKKSAAKGPSEATREVPPPPLRVQRKIAKKVDFLDRVARSSASSSKAQRNSKRRKRKSTKPFLDLSVLGNLLQPDEHRQRASHQRYHRNRSKLNRASAQERVKRMGTSIKGAKGRDAIFVEEAARFSHALRSPIYQADPCNFILQHLQSTLAPPADDNSKQSLQKAAPMQH